MIAHYYGRRQGLLDLRAEFDTNVTGLSFEALQRQARALNLASRPLEVSIDRLPDLRMPAILHWQFDHFVVLESCRSDAIVIHDPDRGRRVISLEEVDGAFTGVALELWPDSQFRQIAPQAQLRLIDAIPRIKKMPAAVLPVLLLTLGVQVFSLAAPVLLQVGVDQVISTSDHQLLLSFTAGFAALLLLQTLFQYARSHASLYVTTLVNFQMRSRLFQRLLELPQAFFLKRGLGDIAARFQDMTNINEALTGQALMSVVDGLLCFVVLALMIAYSPSLAAIVVASTAGYLLVRLWHAHRWMHAHADLVRSYAKETSFFLETVRASQTLKLYRQHNRRAGQYATALANSCNDSAREQYLQQLKDIADSAWFGIENLIIVFVGITSVAERSMSLGMLFAFLGFRLHLNTLVRSVVDALARLGGLRFTLDRVGEILLSPPDPVDRVRFSANLGAVAGHLEARDISFGYDSDLPPLFSSLSFSIRAGESVAIVGPSGVGKTTLVKILTGLLMPSSGDVLLDGLPLTPARIQWLRDNTGTVMQDDCLFMGTCQQNITMFAEKVDTDRLIEVCKMACIYDRIRSLPMGFHTRIGDSGSFFSGGERQRLLIARALYKSPRILILDEATSQLDVTAERSVNEAIKSLGITRIVIAHRPETIKSANQIIDLGAAARKQDHGIGLAIEPDVSSPEPQVHLTGIL